MKVNFYKEKYKQIFLTSLAFSLILIGYLNFSVDKKEDKAIEVSAYANDINIGDVQLVNSEPESNIDGAIVSNENLAEKNEQKILDNQYYIEEQSNNESNINEVLGKNYFEETRIERDKMYSEMLETYQKLINNSETSSDQKAIAIQEISNITNIKNGIMISENLIKNKGFEDVVILVNNGFVSVIIKSYSLNQEQISKIQNIVERELNVEVKNINISNK